MSLKARIIAIFRKRLIELSQINSLLRLTITTTLLL